MPPFLQQPGLPEAWPPRSRAPAHLHWKAAETTEIFLCRCRWKEGGGAASRRGLMDVSEVQRAAVQFVISEVNEGEC